MLRANLNDIQVFMAVVDAGSFVAGGQTMGLSRSAAGKAIARLEQRLSVRLLHRTTRSLGLTDEGREFYRRGLQILASVDDAEASGGARLLKITSTCLQNAHRPDQLRCAIALISTNCSGEANPVTPISEPAGR